MRIPCLFRTAQPAARRQSMCILHQITGCARDPQPTVCSTSTISALSASFVPSASHAACARSRAAASTAWSATGSTTPSIASSSACQSCTSTRRSTAHTLRAGRSNWRRWTHVKTCRAGRCVAVTQKPCVGLCGHGGQVVPGVVTH